MMYRMYDFKCPACGSQQERIVKDGEKNRCPKCDTNMDKLPPVVRVNMGVGPYGRYDETLGEYVHTNRQHRQLMQQQGVTPKGATPKPDGEAWV